MTAFALALGTEDPDATRAVAAALARLCRPGDVVLVSGDLGAGKTTFAQGFGAALGVREPIVSPTFTLVRQYRLPSGTPHTGGGRVGGDGADRGSLLRQFLHADLYRLSHRHEVADLGLAQLVEDGGVAVVEWGEAAERILGDDWLRVDLEVDAAAEHRRTIQMQAHGGTWPARWSALRAALLPWRRAA